MCPPVRKAARRPRIAGISATVVAIAIVMGSRGSPNCARASERLRKDEAQSVRESIAKVQLTMDIPSNDHPRHPVALLVAIFGGLQGPCLKRGQLPTLCIHRKDAS